MICTPERRKAKKKKKKKKEKQKKDPYSICSSKTTNKMLDIMSAIQEASKCR
jgi:hypothetical protein